MVPRAQPQNETELDQNSPHVAARSGPHHNQVLQLDLGLSSLGGPYTSHNTKECHKYDKDGKAVAASTKKPYSKKPYKKHGGGEDKQMAYLQDTIESLVKKGLKKAAKKKRKKRSRDKSSSNFDSE